MDEQITAKLRTPFPPQLVKKIQGNDYISGQTAIDRLIQATGDSWSFQITNVIHSAGHVAMQGELTIGGFTRTAWGESKSTGNAKEELFKNAETDTLKRCARLFGVALELYGDFMEADDSRQQPAHRPQTRQSPPQDARPHEPARPATATDRSEPTPRQIRYLHAVAREVGLDNDALNERSRQGFGVDVGELTRKQTSDLLEAIQNDRISPFILSQDGPSERDLILEALDALTDARDLAGYRSRISAAQLDDDKTVETAYKRAYKRLHGTTAVSTPDAQPALV